jgi:cardiolipin synthase A/B
MTSNQLAVLLAVLAVLVDIVIRVVAVVIVARNRRPQTALAWLVGIFFLPYIGLPLFLIAGTARLPKARRKKQTQVDALIRRAADGLQLVPPVLPDWLQPIATLNENLGAIPMLGGNSATIIGNDDDALAALIADIERATTTVHVEFYIMALDETSAPFFDALEGACSRGVVVRVLLDHLGSRGYPGYKAATERLTSMGALWHVMLPFRPLKGKLQRPDLRNHRKLMVVDGLIAHTGSRNLIDPSYQKKKNVKRGLQWHDFMARFEGPVVAAIDAIFATDWYCETDELLVAEVADPETRIAGDLACQVVPSGPGFDGENNLRLFNSLVYSARERVILTSPYFVPDDSMLYAITSAAQSGLDVQLFVSEIGDQFLVFHAQRSYYETLLKAGVRIWLYEGPTILHAKHVTIDDDVSVIGSSNLDMRSFTLDLEISVMVHSASFTAGMREIEQGYRDHSRELTLDEWNQRGFLVHRFDDLARLTATVQ